MYSGGCINRYQNCINIRRRKQPNNQCIIQQIRDIMYGLDKLMEAKGMHIAHLNARSIPNKWEMLKMNVMSTNLHILGISETWLNESLPDELYRLPNYHLLRNDRNWRDNNTARYKKRGDVAMYIRNELNYSETSHKHLNTSSINIESQ